MKSLTMMPQLAARRSYTTSLHLVKSQQHQQRRPRAAHNCNISGGGSSSSQTSRRGRCAAAAAAAATDTARAAAAPTPDAAAAAAAAANDAAAATPMLLADVRVVLVAPKTPSNIGAAARACANFEAPRLVVVAPRCDPRAGEAYKIACGESVLERMAVVDTLADALAECTGSIGFTRRAGSTRLTHVSMAALLREYPNAVPGMLPGWQPQSFDGQQQQQEQQEQQQLDSRVNNDTSSSSSSSNDGLWQAIASQGATALVFGREESGLTEEELRLCTHACAIPTGRVQPSMNLSHAVATVLSGLFERRLAAAGLEELPGGRECAQENPRVQSGLQPASAAELEALLAKFAAIARAAGVSDAESLGGGNQGSHGRRRLALGHLRALMSRARANTWEVRSLHGLATAALKSLGGGGGSSDDGGGGGGGSSNGSTSE